MPYALVEAYDFNFAVVSMRAWLLVLYYAVVVTVIGFTLFYAGLAKISSVAAGVHMAWVPLSAMLIAVTFLSEPFGLLDFVSAISVLTAVIVVSIRGKAAALQKGSYKAKFLVRASRLFGNKREIKLKKKSGESSV